MEVRGLCRGQPEPGQPSSQGRIQPPGAVGVISAEEISSTVHDDFRPDFGDPF
jgi:hypothetical protein